MKKILIALSLGLVLVACGGSPPPAEDEEVSATWTSGDDAPLEQPLEEPERESE